MVNGRSVSSNSHQERFTALQGPHNVHLEYVFVLQIEGVILQNEDMFQMTIVRPVGAIIVSWWHFEETQRPFTICIEFKLFHNSILKSVFVLQIEGVILQNEDMFQMIILWSLQCNNCLFVLI